MTFRRALVAAAICAMAFCWVGAAFAASSTVVVSEFRFRGPGGASDEFVELYNLSSAPVDISGWKVNGSNNAGTTSTRATIPAGTLLGAGCHFLLTNPTAYSGGVTGDSTFATGFTDDGGVALLAPASALVDAVGLSAGSAYKEGTPLASLGTTTANQSYERKPGGSAGSGTDTDNNAADFQALSPSQPQDLLSSCVSAAPAPTSPSGTGAASPASVAQGASTLLTVATSPGANPASTGVSVIADLTQIGGPAAASFHDDGLAGDATAGDGTYSYQATVAAATAAGAKSLPFTVADAQSRSGTGSISLTVTAPSTPNLAGLVISQVYGGGGNSGATFTNDFVELFDPTSAAVDLSGASVQYNSPAGTGTWQVTNLSGTIQPHHYYLVQESQGAGGTVALPTPDAIGTIAMGATAGKVALVATQTALSGSTCPTPVDLVGFGTTASCSETAPAPAPSNTTADLRANGGCTDTNNNAADFTAGAPTPRNSASTPNTCTGGTGNAPVTIACGSDLTTPQGTAASTNVSATDPDGVVTSLSLVSVTPAPAQGSITLSGVTPATAPGGTANGTLVADAQLPVGTYTVQLQAANNDSPPQTATCSLHVNVTGLIPIGAVQGSVPDSADGATFDSPYLGQTVTVRGVVTELTFDAGDHGFFLQNTAATADADPLSSDGIFVFTSTFTDLVNHYTPVVGDEIVLTGRVNEFFHQTELGSASATKVGTGTVTPFVADPPSDSADAARYWERHEGMQSTVPTGSVVDSPTHFYASTADTEFYAIAPDAPVALRSDPYARRSFRDAHPLDDQPGAFDNGNGYRILVTDEGIKVGNATAQLPPVHTFQTFTAPATGGVYFDFGKYSVSVASQPQVVDGVDPAQNDPPQAFDRSSAYSITNFNMDNLYDYRNDPFDGCDFVGDPGCPGVSPPFDYPPSSDAVYQQRETEIAHQIVEDLHSPDVIVVAEAEDQDICTVQNWTLVCGTTNNADGKADTLQELAVHIHAIGGPDYDVAYDRNGADARGIVCAFLYRMDRVQLLPASATDAVLGSSPSVSYRGTPLAFNSDVSNPKALNAVLPADVDVSTGHDGSNVFTRAAQVAHFRVSPTVPGASTDIWVVANHFTSGPDADVGQRREQAAYNAAIVGAIQSQEPQAKIMVAGDLNEYPRPDDPFPPPNTSDQLAPLYNAGLHDLYDTVIANHPSAAYSYVFEGQAQDLDHQFVTDSFFAGLQAVNEAHINSDYPLDTPGPDNRGTSDHDPMVSRWALAVDRPPTVSAGGPYSVDEGGTTTLTASGSDADGDSLTYAWDLNNDGTFETTGQSVAFAAGDGPATQTVSVRATDPSGLSATDSASVTVRNVAPTATFGAPATATVGTGFTLTLTSPADPSSADVVAGFTYAFDCGDGSGYGAFGSAPSRSCTPPVSGGARAVRGEIQDKDGGISEYTATVAVADVPPTVSAGGPYSVDEGGTTTLTATGSTAGGGALTYAWDLNNDGTFETSGQSVIYAAGDGPSSNIVGVRATDGSSSLSATSSTIVTVRNVAPTATFGAPSTVSVGTGFTLTLTAPHDPSSADTAAGFTFAFDCGDGSGYGAFGSAASRACAAPAAGGARVVRGEIRDKDGGLTEYTATVTVSSVAPTVSAGGPYSVDEGGTVTLTASGSSPGGGTLTFAWDLNNDGTFERSGQSVAYAAGDGPAANTVRVRATDSSSGLSATSTTTVTVRNVAPTATFTAPATVLVGSGFTLKLTAPHDPSAADAAAGFTYAFDCGDGSGYGAFGSVASRACPAPITAGAHVVRGQIRDKDGGSTEYTRTVDVSVTYDAVCALARVYSSKKLVADLVCAELSIAEAADRRGQERPADAAVKLAEATVRAESGRAFTHAEADTLADLMRRL